MMESAKSERADTYAPVNLDLAAKNLARAEVELSKGDRKRAYEWARRSQADAELAVKISKGARLEDETKKMSAVAETKEGE